MRTLFFLAIMSWSISANAWVDGTYRCDANPDVTITLTTPKHAAKSSVPLFELKHKDGSFFRGFATIEKHEKTETVWLNSHGGSFAVDFSNDGSKMVGCKVAN